MFGICGLFPAILGLTDTSGPIRPHVPIRYEGQPAARFARTYANEERPAWHRLRRALERRDACRLGLASVCSVRDVRGDLRVRLGMRRRAASPVSVSSRPAS